MIDFLRPVYQYETADYRTRSGGWVIVRRVVSWIAGEPRDALIYARGTMAVHFAQLDKDSE